jgi:hypothetical protein
VSFLYLNPSLFPIRRLGCLVCRRSQSMNSSWRMRDRIGNFFFEILEKYLSTRPPTFLMAAHSPQILIDNLITSWAGNRILNSRIPLIYGVSPLEKNSLIESAITKYHDMFSIISIPPLQHDGILCKIFDCLSSHLESSEFNLALERFLSILEKINHAPSSVTSSKRFFAEAVSDAIKSEPNIKPTRTSSMKKISPWMLTSMTNFQAEGKDIQDDTLSNWFNVAFEFEQEDPANDVGFTRGMNDYNDSKNAAVELVELFSSLVVDTIAIVKVDVLNSVGEIYPTKEREWDLFYRIIFLQQQQSNLKFVLFTNPSDSSLAESKEEIQTIQDHPFVSRLLILYCKSLQKRSEPLHVGVSLLVTQSGDSYPQSLQSSFIKRKPRPIKSNRVSTLRMSMVKKYIDPAEDTSVVESAESIEELNEVEMDFCRAFDPTNDKVRVSN